MFFRQFYLPALGHASYLIGDENSGQALLFDPRRDVDDYFAVAREEGLRITHVLDSHGHNDYLSGITEVVARADVEVLGSAAGNIGYPHRPIKDGETITLGELDLEVLHTPGHTPEHVALLVRDLAVSEEPAMLLSGGSLLVGDLARPDLLGGDDAAREAAQEFCHTIQSKILTLPDHVEVFPTHVAGSLCGGNIGSRLSTTVGYERRTNAVLSRVDSSDGFVRECIRLDNLPAVPPYWRRMRTENLGGVTPLGVAADVPARMPTDVRDHLDEWVVLDTRQPEAYGGGHIPGALNVGLGSSFPTWAGTIVPAREPIVLVVDDPDDVQVATWHLLRIGYDRPVGWLAGGMFAWRTAGLPMERLEQRTVEEVSAAVSAGDMAVLDVRQPAEWAEGHAPGAQFITGAELPRRLAEVARDRLTAVVCGSGYRSSASASLLARHGHKHLVNVLGGMSAWKERDLPLDTDTP